MKVFNNPHFQNQQQPKPNSKSASLQASRVRPGELGFNHSVSHGEDPPSIDFQSLLTQLNANQVEDVDCFDLIKEMTKLKGRVIGLLKKYQVLLQTENAKQLKTQIKGDVQNILTDYQSVIETYQQDGTQLEIEDNIPTVEQEKDINIMFNLVEEFLEKFIGRKAQINVFSHLQQDKLNRHGIGPFPVVEHEDRQSMYDFQVDLQELADSGNDNLTAKEAQQARIALSNSQRLRSQFRRRFFDLAIKLKEKLPLYHSGRKILVSVLFEDAEEEGVEEGCWEEWILRSLQKEIQQ